MIKHVIKQKKDQIEVLKTTNSAQTAGIINQSLLLTGHELLSPDVPSTSNSSSPPINFQELDDYFHYRENNQENQWTHSPSVNEYQSSTTPTNTQEQAQNQFFGIVEENWQLVTQQVIEINSQKTA
ncbi:hypothetical protein [Spiroplasma endosymbiont of Nebria brevicollis]|uniref:hypothetical protein n=1 Tax=Spiroplasma endosymbiont of Nebria brevicollis TaxID=3066284 RepID=UPI00313C6B20